MIKEKAKAKLDLNIHILPEKKDGLYIVKYLDCQIDLSDTLYFKKSKNNEVICKKYPELNNENNFAFVVLDYFKKFDKKNNTKIIIDKKIPIRAGFGGGSSDAASAVKGLERLWDVNMQNNLSDLSYKLGKDFFYSYHGDLCEIIGEGKKYTVNNLKIKLPAFWLIIIVPDEKKPSTGWMYGKLKLKEIGKNQGKLEELKRAILDKDRNKILQNLFNDFEKLAAQTFPIVKKIKKELVNVGAGAALMAGAGLSIVGFYNSKKDAKYAFNNLKLKYKNIILTRTI